MRGWCLPSAFALAFGCTAAVAQEQFSAVQIKTGSAIFAQNCAPCHGARMLDAQAAFDLRKFPPGEKDRFIVSVTKGKNQMPPWGDLFKADEIEALWAYVIAGEKR
jgi:mono/diheme cytochrome c family protein